MNANETKKTTETCLTGRQAYEWLMTKCRGGGGRRIEVLSWKRLARIYYANRPGSKIRKAINTEARRCGYTPRTILALNA